MARSRALPGSGCAVEDAWEARSEQDALGPGRRVYVCVHGGEVQGVCTARADARPVRPPSSASNTRPAPPSEKYRANPG